MYKKENTQKTNIELMRSILEQLCITMIVLHVHVHTCMCTYMEGKCTYMDMHTCTCTS